MPRRFIKGRGRPSERGVALLIAVLMLVGLSGLAMTTMTSTGIDMAAARANAGVVARSSCLDEVARFAMDQVSRDTLYATYTKVTNQSCNNAALAWVNFPIPGGNDGSNCVIPQPTCTGESGLVAYTMPTTLSTSGADPCRNTRAVAVWAPTPYTPGRTNVGNMTGQGQDRTQIDLSIRVFAADMPSCEMRFLNSYLDIAFVGSFRPGGNSGVVGN